MSDSTELIAEADRKLEENSYAEARDLYRAAALMTSPTRATLVNLSIAEDQDRLEFRRQLSLAHPTSTQVRLAEASALTSAHRARQAIQIYTQMLGWETIDSHKAFAVRLARLRVAASSGDYQVLQNDFLALWKASAADPRLRRLRPTMLRSLAQLHDVKAIGMLQVLFEDTDIGSPVKHFLESKITELRSLAAAIEEC
jgi:hypothetical protein